MGKPPPHRAGIAACAEPADLTEEKAEPPD
jgi:hypothetical protein